jgi:cation diffusion facilitator CzcD-associated flavoprotein CzcO
MLQRSPTYFFSLPGIDTTARWLDRKLPSQVAYDITRWRNVARALALFKFSRRFPKATKRFMIGEVKKNLGPGYDIAKDFTPRYGPWDQRLCLVPDGDLFEAMKSGRASVVTDHIETFTETGIALKSGTTLDADLIVTATGLKLQLVGGMKLVVDGQPVEVGKIVNYKGTMFSDVPNFASTFGYTNASWTLKADLIAGFVCRLLNHMDREGFRQCVPRLRDGEVGAEPLLDFSSGYVQRAIADLPKQGKKAPWKLYQNYLLDLVGLRYGALEDGVIEFRRARSRS